MFNFGEVLIVMVFFAAVAFYLGMRYAEFKLIAKMISLLTEEELKQLEALKEKLEKVSDDEEADKIIEEASAKVNLKIMKQELVDGQHFFYDDKGTFVCQGSSQEDAVKNFELNNKAGMNGCVITESGDKFYIIKGQVVNSLPV